MGNSPTQRDLLIEIKTELVGMDGHGGMRKDIADTKEAGVEGRKKLHAKIEEAEKKIEEVGKNCVTKDDCKDTRAACAEAKAAPQKAKFEVLRIRALEVTIMGGIISAFLAVVFAIAKAMKWL